MKKPNAIHYNPDPASLRAKGFATGLTQKEIAARLGLGLRTLEAYLSDTDSRKAPYTVQYALERLADD